ncbi:MAG TPA: SprT family zinc-dependent metalloprotease [Candidatus Cloacimonadota bacterium]|nr:SprT family zinc-dependent metalloprotease [Candidatus Cloacimonadota bacterium]
MNPEKVTIVRTNRKSILIRILANEIIQVRAPLGTTDDYIFQLLQKRDDRIQALLDNYRRNHRQHSFTEGSSIPLMGKPITLQYMENCPYLWRLAMSTLYINKDYVNQLDIVMKDFYQERAKYLIKRCHELAVQHHFIKVKVSTRWNKRRWGSYSSRMSISLNCALIMAPPEVIDYVIVHEYCHSLHPNHSKAFWKSVEMIVPDYRIHYAWLRDNSHILHLLDPITQS